MRQSNKNFPYRGPRQRKDDAIHNFFCSVKYHNDTTNVELIDSTKILLTDVYDIGSKSGLNIDKIIQGYFCESGIPINNWPDNAQEEFMGIV